MTGEDKETLTVWTMTADAGGWIFFLFSDYNKPRVRIASRRGFSFFTAF